jgi:hypothetical protein
MLVFQSSWGPLAVSAQIRVPFVFRTFRAVLDCRREEPTDNCIDSDAGSIQLLSNGVTRDRLNPGNVAESEDKI